MILEWAWALGHYAIQTCWMLDTCMPICMLSAYMDGYKSNAARLQTEFMTEVYFAVGHVYCKALYYTCCQIPAQVVWEGDSLLNQYQTDAAVDQCSMILHHCDTDLSPVAAITGSCVSQGTEAAGCIISTLPQGE